MYVHKRDSQKFAVILTFIVVLALTSISAYAQVSGATLTGTVVDSSGAAIPNAQLSIKNVGTGEARAVSTDSAGFYTAPNLLPGKYEVTVTSPGFSTAVRSGITLTVGAQQSLNISMTVGEVSAKVEVTGEAPDVQLTSSTISGVVSQNTVVELPLNGRDWTSLATLQPGVEGLGSVQANTGSKDRSRRGYGLQMSISGTRPTQNNYRIDGINVNDYANGGPGSVEGATAGVDAIQEFSVLTSNYSAEYGRTSGGVINAITRSGANQLHGDVYEFLRNSRLDARNAFDPVGQKVPEFRRNQFGGAVGGPICKDKTFFFVDYEGLRQNQVLTTRINVPSAAVRGIGTGPGGGPGPSTLCSNPAGADPSNPCSTQTLTGATHPDPVTGIDTTAQAYLGLWGLPNAGIVGNGDTGIYQFPAAHITSENFGTGRLDHKFSDKDSLFISYEYDGATATQPDPANDVLVGNATGREFAAIEETHVFSARLVNSARIGFNRPIHTGQGLTAINPLASQTTLGESAGFDNPQIDISQNNITSIQPGLNQVEQINFFQNSFQAYDDLFFTKGIHSLKFGFAVERIQTNVFNPAPVGEFNFPTLVNFLTNTPGSPTTYTLIAPIPINPFLGFGFRSTIFGGYIQDDIRLRPSLTVNVGLRYEMSTVPSEVNGRLSELRNPTDQPPTQVHLGNGIFKNPTYRNFEPRVGIAWDPFGNGKTSIRGGFGMFDVLPLPYEIGQFATNAAPFVENGGGNNFNPGDFPTGAFQTLVNNFNNGTGLRYPYIDPNPKRNYVMQWNVSVQRELVPNLTAMVAYVGSRGVHMEFRADDINTTQPIQTSAGYLFPIPGTGTVLNPKVGQMDTLQWNNDSFFKGIELQIVKKMSHGFQVEGSYTWSKAVDGGDGAIASDSFLNSIPSLLYFLPKYRRGPSDFDVRHNLTVNYIWQIPARKSFAGPLGYISRGWQVGGIVEVRSGLPFTPLIGGDPLGTGLTSATFAYPDRVAGPGCDTPVNPGNVGNYIKLQCFGLPMATPAIASQCVPFSGAGVPAGTCANLLGSGGRNEIYGPGMFNVDFSVFKDNKIRENLNLQFRAEFFNAFNHVNYNSPLANSTLFNSDGTPAAGAGTFDSTSTSSREIQFALKLIF